MDFTEYMGIYWNRGACGHGKGFGCMRVATNDGAVFPVWWKRKHGDVYFPEAVL